VKIRKLVQLLIGVATIAALYWLSKDSLSIVAQLKNISYSWLAGSVTVVIVNRFLMAWKWRMLLEPFKIHIGITRATMIYCTAQLWGLFLPATLGTDAIRVTCLKREGISVGTSSASIIIERLLGLISSFSVTAAAAGFVWYAIGAQNLMLTLLLIALCGLAFGVSILFLAISGRPYRWMQQRVLARINFDFARDILQRIHTGIYRYRHHGVLIVKFLFASALEALTAGLFFYTIFSAFGISVPFAVVLVANGVASLLSRIPISLSGLGVFEGGLSFVLLQFGVPIEQTITAALLGRLLQMVVWLPFWGSYMATLPATARAVPKS